MRLAGFEAVLTLALVEDVGLEFPARVLLGRRHGRRGGGEAQRPGPARAEWRTAAGEAAAPCTAGWGGSGRAQRGRRGMPPAAAASQPGRGRRPERSPGGQGGLAGAGMRAGPSLTRRCCAARRAQAPSRRAPAPGPHRAHGPCRLPAQPPPGRRGPMDAASRARCLPALEPVLQAPGRCGSPQSVPTAAALRAPRPQQMVAEGLAHSRGGAGGRMPGGVSGRRERERQRAGRGRAPNAIGGPAHQWQQRAPANKETRRPMETGGGNKEHPGVR